RAPPPTRPKPLHLLHLALRQDSGDHSLDPCLFRDRLRGSGVIASDENNLDSHPPKVAYSLSRAFLDRIGNRDETQEFPSARDEHQGPPLAGEPDRGLLHRDRLHSTLLEQGLAPDEERNSIHCSRGAAPSYRAELTRITQGQAAIARGTHHGGRQGMLAQCFEGGRETQHS